MKIIVTVKTKLKYDGRVLAQIKTLSRHFQNYKFFVLIVPDDNIEIKLGDNVTIIPIHLTTRKLPQNPVFLFLKYLEFALKFNNIARKIKPNLIHVHDETVIAGPLVYKYFNKKIKLIYDDHELKNLEKNSGIKGKFLRYVESRIFINADKIVMANHQRLNFAENYFKHISLREKTCIVENYHFKSEIIKSSSKYELKIEPELNYLIHQGRISKGRGFNYLLEIIKSLPADWRLVFVGINKNAFKKHFSNVENKNKLINIGFIPYELLDQFWLKMDAAIILYDTQEINNMLCAPNRLYLAANIGLPLIVNNNPVLGSFVTKYKNGIVLNENCDNLVSFFKTYSHLKTSANKIIGNFSYDKMENKLLSMY